MIFHQARIAKLEARQRRQHPAGNHFITCVQVPWGEDTADALAQHPCPCGAGPGCGLKRFGLVVSEALSDRGRVAGALYRIRGTTPGPDCPNTDLHVILNRVEGRSHDAA